MSSEMNHSTTIKLFLPEGDAKRLRTAELSNWSGKAIAAPRTDINLLLEREELSKSGVYFLLGVDPADGHQVVYIGEAERVAERLKQHKAKDFWNAAIVFVSKDENLTKPHVRYLEGRMIETAKEIGRYKLQNTQASGAKLPESDLNDMEVFLDRIAQLLPVLGSELLTPMTTKNSAVTKELLYKCSIKGADATGERTPNGFVVHRGSTAVLNLRASVEKNGPWIVTLREQLTGNGTLEEDRGFLRFTKDVEFSSPSGAAAVIHGGNVAGSLAWKNADGKTLKEVENS